MNVLLDTSVWSLALRQKTEKLNATETFLVAELSGGTSATYWFG